MSHDVNPCFDSYAFDQLTRRQKRSLTYHILYAAESFDYELTVHAIVDNLRRGYDVDIPSDSDVFHQAADIIQKRDELDKTYLPLLSNWRFDRIGVATRLILRYAVWELLYTDMLATIVINEAIELAKCFAEKDAYKFINGILDELVKKMPDRVERAYEQEELISSGDDEE